MPRTAIAAAGRRRYRKGFVQRSGAQLLLDGAPYKFVGFNAFGIAGGEGTAWTRSFMDSYFAAMRPASMTRTWCFNGNATTTLLDDLVASAESAGQKLILTLNNDLPDLVNDGAKNNTWYASGYASGGWLTWVNTVVSRYRQSPAIGMWEIINEAGQSTGGLDGTTMRNFYGTVAGTIKALDPYHLVCTGDNAEYNYATTTGDSWSGEQAYRTASSAADIDVLSIHDYELDFGGTTPISSHFTPCSGAAATLNKPIIVGEVNRSACSLTKPNRSTTIHSRVSRYLAGGASGAAVWNYSDHFYDYCATGGADYILVAGDPLANAMQTYIHSGETSSETWTGSNGAVWPKPWTRVLNAGTIDIQSNAGRILTPAVAYQTPVAYRPGIANGEMLLDITLASTAEQYVDIGVRSTVAGAAPTNGYVVSLRVSQNLLHLYDVATSSGTPAQSVAFTYSATTYRLRFRWQGSTIQARLWATSGSEPGTWTVTTTSSATTDAGNVQFVYTNGATATATSVTVDNLSLTNLG
jgi:hypothetical protein